LEPVFHLQKIDVEDAQQIQAKHHDQDAADAPDVILIGDQDLADETRRSAEGNEYR
jgi:hypothetical protein